MKGRSACLACRHVSGVCTSAACRLVNRLLLDLTRPHVLPEARASRGTRRDKDLPGCCNFCDIIGIPRVFFPRYYWPGKLPARRSRPSARRNAKNYGNRARKMSDPITVYRHRVIVLTFTAHVHKL